MAIPTPYAAAMSKRVASPSYAHRCLGRARALCSSPRSRTPGAPPNRWTDSAWRTRAWASVIHAGSPRSVALTSTVRETRCGGSLRFRANIGLRATITALSNRPALNRPAVRLRLGARIATPRALRALRLAFRHPPTSRGSRSHYETPPEKEGRGLYQTLATTGPPPVGHGGRASTVIAKRSLTR